MVSRRRAICLGLLLLPRRARSASFATSWQKRDLADVPGTDPYVWHGVVHQIDGMRREEPFPPPDPSRFRIIAVGDSDFRERGSQEPAPPFLLLAKLTTSGPP